MNKASVSELKKLFKPTDCRVKTLRGIYVNEDKQVIFPLKENFLSLPEEDIHKYCDIFKKSLSGSFGKNLFNMYFPADEEKDGGAQKILYDLYDSALQDESQVQTFFNELIETYDYPSKYLAMLIYGTYDVPYKATDGTVMEGGDTVYNFIECIICPVDLAKEGLCAKKETFESKAEDWIVKPPMTSFLFPAFNDRAADVHGCLYYSKKPEERNDELVANLLKCELPNSEQTEKSAFSALIEESLGRDCAIESVREITDYISESLQDCEDVENVTISKRDIALAMESAGAAEDSVKKMKSLYDENIGKSEFSVSNVIDTKKLTLQDDNVKVTVKSEVADMVETKVIDGHEYILIPVSSGLSVNGIAITPQAG